MSLVVLVTSSAGASPTDDDLTLPPRAVWRSSAGHHTLGSWHPRADGGRLFVPGRFAVEALDLDRGDVLWSAPLATPPRVAASAVGRSELAVGGRVGHDADGSALPDLHLLDPGSGRLLWSRTVGGVFAAPVWSDGRLVVASTHALVVLDADLGTEEWRVDFPRDEHDLPGGPAEAGPLVVDGRVVTGAGDRRLHAFALDGGAALWSVPLARRLYAKPAIAGDLVICASGPALLAVAIDDGAVRWQTPLAGEPLLAGPVTDGVTVYVSSGSGRSMVALSAEDGAILWETPLAAVCHTQPALSRTMLWLGDVDGGLVALDRRDGGVLWRATLADGYLSDPVIVDGRLVVGADGGELAVLTSSLGTTPLVPAPPRLSVGPNPARESVRIQSDAARVEIHDALGRCVRTLAMPGPSVDWDLRDARGRRLPAAVYFVHTQADAETVKLLLLH